MNRRTANALRNSDTGFDPSVGQLHSSVVISRSSLVTVSHSGVDARTRGRCSRDGGCQCATNTSFRPRLYDKSTHITEPRWALAARVSTEKRVKRLDGSVSIPYHNMTPSNHNPVACPSRGTRCVDNSQVEWDGEVKESFLAWPKWPGRKGGGLPDRRLTALHC